MTLLNNNVSDICSGYDEIMNAHVRLKEKWRDPLMAAYGQKRLKYNQARKEYQSRGEALKRQARQSLAFVGLLFFLAVVAFFVDFWFLDSGILMGLGLPLAGIGVLAGLYVTWKWWRYKSQVPQPPAHPLQSNLIPPLLPIWKQSLNGRLPSNKEYDGADGEHDFVRQLQRVLDSSHFIIYRLQQKRGDDIDVTVVGPTGIWVFEVKYWAGSITWQDGQWRRQKTYYETGGVPVTENPVVRQGPDEQWRRMAADVAKSIRNHDLQLVSRFLTNIRSQGGIVFTHPKATYHIAADCPCEWGNILHWTRKLASAPRIKGWDDRTTFLVLDALLTRHHQVMAVASQKSMYEVGKRLIRQEEEDLAAWINSAN